MTIHPHSGVLGTVQPWKITMYWCGKIFKIYIKQKRQGREWCIQYTLPFGFEKWGLWEDRKCTHVCTQVPAYTSSNPHWEATWEITTSARSQEGNEVAEGQEQRDIFHCTLSEFWTMEMYSLCKRQLLKITKSKRNGQIPKYPEPGLIHHQTLNRLSVCNAELEVLRQWEALQIVTEGSEERLILKVQRGNISLA